MAFPCIGKGYDCAMVLAGAMQSPALVTMS
jgi:hypothetical protein